MRYTGISVQKYDVKTHKKSRKHGVRARPLPRPVAGTGHGSRSHAPGLFPAGKAPPREGMPRRPGIDQSSRNDFCPIPSRESRHSRLPRRRPPSAVPCVPQGSPPYEPAFLPGARGRAAASILIKYSSMFILRAPARRKPGGAAPSGMSGVAVPAPPVAFRERDMPYTGQLSPASRVP